MGTVDAFERACEINPKDGIFCELKATGCVPVCFTFDEDFLFSPPPQVKLYFTQGEVAVYICDFLRADQSLKPLASARIYDTHLRLYMQGRLFLELARGSDLKLIPLCDYLEEGKLFAIGNDFLVEAEKGFALVSNDGRIIVQSQGKVLEKEGSLKAEIPFHDSMGHTAMCVWEGETMTACNIQTHLPPTEATFALALFESVLIGADASSFLSDELAPRAGALKAFLGDYCSVVLSNEPRRVGLVYERKERVYDVRYFIVSVQDNKITNIEEE